MTNKQFNNLTIVQTGRNNIWAYCPYHTDSDRPNLSISITNIYYGRYKCWACGIEGWLTEAQKKVLRKDVRPVHKNERYNPIDWDSLTQKYYHSYRPAIEGKRIADFWNVRGDCLSSLCIGWAGGQAYTFPFRNEDNEIIGIQLRYPDGSKRCVEGSKLGLFLPQGIDWFEQDTIFITEGVSDLAVLLDMGFVGIGIPSAQTGHEMAVKWLKQWSFNQVIVIRDNDNVGFNSALRFFELMKNKPLIIQPNTAKDLREWVQIDGKDKVRKELESVI